MDLASWPFGTWITTLLFSIVGGVISGVIVSVLRKTKADKVFDKNAKVVYSSLFSHILRIDSFKKNIFELWETHPRYKAPTVIELNSSTYDAICQFRSFMFQEIESMSLYRNSPYILLSEYLLLQQYALSAYNHLHKVSNLETGMGIHEKSLEYHMYYAKEIIEKLPSYAVPKQFANKWNSEFQKRGGIQAIEKPSIDLGNTVDPHHNLNNQVLYFDAQHVSVMGVLNEIKNTISSQGNQERG